jgi:hypothetical protein
MAESDGAEAGTAGLFSDSGEEKSLADRESLDVEQAVEVRSRPARRAA